MDISLLSNEASRGMLPPKRKRPSAGVAGDLPWTEVSREEGIQRHRKATYILSTGSMQQIVKDHYF